MSRLGQVRVTSVGSCTRTRRRLPKSNDFAPIPVEVTRCGGAAHWRAGDSASQLVRPAPRRTQPRLRDVTD
jgi:hypothetical protein